MFQVFRLDEKTWTPLIKMEQGNRKNKEKTA